MGAEESTVFGPSRTLAPAPRLSLTHSSCHRGPLGPPGHCFSTRPQESQYPWSQRVSFAKDIASGMVSRLWV